MIAKIIKLLSVLALVLSYGWMLSNPDWEPKITLIASLIAFLGFEFREDFIKPNLNDIKLFKEFIALLPSDGDIAFIKDYDMAGPIDKGRIMQLRQFRHEWDNAEHEFSGWRMEKKRRKLFDSTVRFFNAFGKYTFATVNNFQRVPPDWQQSHPDKHEAAVNELNSSAQAIYDAHQELVRIGTKHIS